MELKSKLPKIDVNLELEIRSGLSSIYKLRKDNIYKKFIENYQDLQKAEYVIYPNDNADRGTVFLDKDGRIIKKVNFYANELVYEPNDFEIEYPKIHSKILETFENISINV